MSNAAHRKKEKENPARFQAAAAFELELNGGGLQKKEERTQKQNEQHRLNSTDQHTRRVSVRLLVPAAQGAVRGTRLPRDTPRFQASQPGCFSDVGA